MLNAWLIEFLKQNLSNTCALIFPGSNVLVKLSYIIQLFVQMKGEVPVESGDNLNSCLRNADIYRKPLCIFMFFKKCTKIRI